MKLSELKSEVINIIENIKNHGLYLKENDIIDYKLKLKIINDKLPAEQFLCNFAKDIISFSNSNGGILLLGFEYNQSISDYEDKGLENEDAEILKNIDINHINQKLHKVTQGNITIDIQAFNITNRKFYYILIEKQTQIIVPISDFLDYRLKKGEIYYRKSGNNEVANSSTSKFNTFLQIKANEKNKEFMEIWSKLLPEMIDINPREVLIINPIHNIVYGFNGKENVLSSSEIEIDKTRNGVFNIILNAISAGEIGKITDNEGKPIYKIVGEINTEKKSISLNTLTDELNNKSVYKINSVEVKKTMKYLGWVNNERFNIQIPNETEINNKYKEYLWIQTIDIIKKSSKIVFSRDAIDKIYEIIENKDLHQEIFGKLLAIKSQ